MKDISVDKVREAHQALQSNIGQPEVFTLRDRQRFQEIRMEEDTVRRAEKTVALAEEIMASAIPNKPAVEDSLGRWGLASADVAGFLGGPRFQNEASEEIARSAADFLAATSAEVLAAALLLCDLQAAPDRQQTNGSPNGNPFAQWGRRRISI